ncbi:MAG: hypothetical protein JWN95_733 [Frankiales bacterium]|nr:hypothetical protein [Frankiales bacterium]
MVAYNQTKANEKPPVPPMQTIGPLGAQAFARFYMQTNDWSYATGSTTYMRHYFTSTCDECAFFAKGVDTRTRAHHRYIGDRLIVRDIFSDGDETNPHEQEVVVTYDVTSVELVDSDGKYVDADPAALGLKDRLHLKWTAAGWVVTRGTPVK